MDGGGIDAGAFVTGRVGLDGVSDAFERLVSGTTERKMLVRPHG